MKKHLIYKQPKKARMNSVVEYYVCKFGEYELDISFDGGECVLILGEVEIESYPDGMGYIVFSLETGDSLTMARSGFELIED